MQVRSTISPCHGRPEWYVNRFLPSLFCGSKKRERFHWFLWHVSARAYVSVASWLSVWWDEVRVVSYYPRDFTRKAWHWFFCPTFLVILPSSFHARSESDFVVISSVFSRWWQKWYMVSLTSIQCWWWKKKWKSGECDIRVFSRLFFLVCKFLLLLLVRPGFGKERVLIFRGQEVPEANWAPFFGRDWIGVTLLKVGDRPTLHFLFMLKHEREIYY